MKVRKVYKDFQIPQNLQEHMLRVGALLKIIKDNWQGEEIDWEALIQAGLLHDIAKPLNFDLAKQAQFGMTPPEIENLRQLQVRIQREFGEKEHEACIKILLEVGGKPRAAELLNSLEWEYIERLWQNKEIESLVLIYADMRIGPKGILSLPERLNELRRREPKSLDFELLLKYGLMVEAEIQKQMSLKINRITEADLEMQFRVIQESDMGGMAAKARKP